MPFDFEKMYCGLIRRGDIFICEHDSAETPVVVLQDTVLNGGLPTAICAVIESARFGSDTVITEVLLGEEETGLGKQSACMLHKLVTIDRRKFIAKKGELKANTLKQLYQALDVTLGRFRD